MLLLTQKRKTHTRNKHFVTYAKTSSINNKIIKKFTITAITQGNIKVLHIASVI